MLSLSVLVVVLSQTPDSLLGDVGESCRARSDCRSGLKCINAMCTAPAPVTKEGQPCEATSECSSDGSLRCLAKVCSKPKSIVNTQPSPAPVAYPTPASAPAPATAWAPPPPPPAYAPVSDRPVGPPPMPARDVATDNQLVTDAVADTSMFTETKFFLGLDATAGVLTSLATIGPHVKLGWLFKRVQLDINLGFLATSYGGMVAARTSLGFIVPFVDSENFSFFWSPKGGLSSNIGPVFTFGAHADLVSFGIRAGHFFIDLQLPSVGAHFLGGGGVSIPVQGKLSVAWVF